jgi:hypothetical protein
LREGKKQNKQIFAAPQQRNVNRVKKKKKARAQSQPFSQFDQISNE